MKFLSNAFHKSSETVTKEAATLNKEIAHSELDKNTVAETLTALQKAWEGCDLQSKEGNKSATQYADVHKEVSHSWPFRFKDLKTITILTKLKSKSAKKFLELYKVGGPAKVIFL